MKSFYFDHAATTPIHPEVAHEMIAVMQQGPANASSMHHYGRAAKAHLNRSRDTLARHLGASLVSLPLHRAEQKVIT